MGLDALRYSLDPDTTICIAEALYDRVDRSDFTPILRPGLCWAFPLRFWTYNDLTMPFNTTRLAIFGQEIRASPASGPIWGAPL